MGKVDGAVRERKRRVTARGLATRDKILNSTIACIVRSGFSALSVENVIEDSGISRGSILHHFPNRTALAIAAADRSLRLVLDQSDERYAQLTDPYEKLLSHAQIAWETHNLPPGLALMEILQAARWDTDLSAALRPIIESGEQEVKQRLSRLAANAGVRNPAQYVSRGWLLVATVRGMIIEHSFNPNREIINAAIADMKEAHRRFCERVTT